MKKIILSTIAITSILANCSKEDAMANESNNDKSAFKSSILNENNSVTSRVAGKEYTEQLPYLDAHTDFLTFSIENDLNHKINDSEIEWKVINSLYNTDLSTAEKQFLIYIILAKKDLLGTQNETPTQDQAALIANYAKELVASKYIGYCLLYNTLVTLNKDSQNTQLVKDLAKQIVTYSGTETFHSDFVRKPEGRDPYINKVKEDYTFLDKIEDLQ
ncbi:hypothetical protein [Chryseobacterium populi]|uniref:Uncharacterized protein n=1 Tax=Chryseobacterium populi TaxID=1144316 RepID=J2JW48_9FLAO|nr:hypothetical protein [Chryseobacterium populi]EJL72050.1 hypothetical protein PMI13_02041 [Chryseobacterium populi]